MGNEDASKADGEEDAAAEVSNASSQDENSSTRSGTPEEEEKQDQPSGLLRYESSDESEIVRMRVLREASLISDTESGRNTSEGTASTSDANRSETAPQQQTSARHQEEDNEASRSKTMPRRPQEDRRSSQNDKQSTVPEETKGDEEDDDMPLPAPLLQSQSTPGAFQVAGISANGRRNGGSRNHQNHDDNQSQTDDLQSTTTTDTSVLAMVPPRYDGSHFSGVPSNWARDEDDNDTNDLHSLVPVDSRPDEYRSSAAAASQSFDSSMGFVEAQVVSDHALEERVAAEVEARLQQEVHQRLSAIATAQVIGTGSGRAVDNGESSHPPPQRVDIDAENGSIDQIKSGAASKDDNIQQRQDEKTKEKGKQRKRRWYLWVGVVLVGVLCAAGGAAAAILLTQDRSDDGELPTKAPSAATSVPSFSPAEVAPPSLTSPPSLLPRLEDMRQVLTKITDEDTLLDPSSPQHSAMLWLVYDDGLQLDPVPSYELFQRYILATLYFSTQGSRWRNKCRFLSASSVCDWRVESLGLGVFCRNGTFEADSIQLDRNGLRGPLPQEITFLEIHEIHMKDNDITALPNAVSNLRNLTVLDLGRNILQTLPQELSEMTLLRSLVVDSNRLTGSIPDLTSLTNLEEIFLGDNRLSGFPAFPDVPADGTAPKLKTISFELNRLGGPIDASVCNLEILNEFSVYSNELTSLPSCVGDLPMLRTVYLHQNAFTGNIDSIFCPLLEGQTVEADCFNKVECTCCTACCDSPNNECFEQTQPPATATESPTSLPTISQISPTPVPSTNISVSILPTGSPIGTVPTLPPSTMSPSETLAIRYTAVREVLEMVSDTQLLDDTSTPQYEAMKWIVEDDPAQVSAADEKVLQERYVVSLLYFAMNGAEWWNSLNFLSASTICDWNDLASLGCFCSEAADATVQEISLFENNLYQQLPTEIFFLTDLQTLHLDGNAISGTIATSIGSLINLRTLTLDFNLLETSIPSELGRLTSLEVLWLNDNMVNSAIPSEIGQLTNIKELALENNGLTGTVPLELRNIRLWEFVYLEANSLRGDLDPVFCPLEGPNLDLWADCGVGLEITCTCCTFCCFKLLGCFEN